MSTKFLAPSLILFLDTIVVAVGGWLFWLVLSKLSSQGDVGQATTVFSLAALVCTVIQLGMEYPLLRRASSEGVRSLYGALIIIGAISLLASPVVVFSISRIYDHSLDNLSGIAIGIIVLQSFGYAARFFLLGLSAVRVVLIIDIIGTLSKFITGILLASAGMGTIGILTAFLVNALVVLLCSLIIALRNQLTTKIGRLFRHVLANVPDRYCIKEILHEAVVNTPSKLSVIVIFSLSVILLASYGIQSNEVAVFYMALQISIVAGGLVASMAYMVIPASADTRTDLTAGSIRIGLSITSIIIVILISMPNVFLGIIGTDYVKGQIALAILSLGILPYTIVVNAIAKFNYSRQSKRLVLIGISQISCFAISFSILVPVFGITGAALSILVGFIASSGVSMWWLGSLVSKYMAVSIISISVGWAAGKLVSVLANGLEIVTILPIIVSITFLILVVMRNISLYEIPRLIKTSIGHNPKSTTDIDK